MSKTNIVINQWTHFHPYDKPKPVDFYYLRLCQDLYKLLSEKKYKILTDTLTKEEMKKLTCMLTAWFEDIVSETGIWPAFINKHHQMYGKYLPFYTTGDDYYPEEINPEDITFLVWYFISQSYKESFLFYPLDTSLLTLGEDIFRFFDKYYETAPENTVLQDFLNIPETETDYFKVRPVLEWLALWSYPFFFHGEDLQEEMIKLAENVKDNEYFIEHFTQLQHETGERFLLGLVTPLLALKGHEWLAEVLGEKHPLSDYLRNMSERKTGYFLYLRHDEKNIYLEHLASQKMIPVTRRSLDIPKAREGEAILFMSLIRWGNEWWFSGISSQYGKKQSIIDDERKNIKDSGLFDEEAAKIEKEVIKKQEELSLIFNHNSHVKFCDTADEMKEFSEAFLDFYMKKLNPHAGKTGNKKEMEDARKNREEKMEDQLEEFAESGGLVFFNPGKGIEMLFGYNALFDEHHPERQNMDEEMLAEMAEELFTSGHASPGLIRYFVEKGKLPFLRFEDEKPGENLLLSHLDFMLRFANPEGVRAKPAVTIVNSEKILKSKL